ncbi:response regulator [Dyella caseinilytica]|uniref:histidine kinase n=1 Tax=Dyella caseinilytica TaxID=1849581 RepID=A0ABX7GV50_9GAMM|nr:response regulator [Dyella caseinilytica]QRN54325.1 response regulator [Dyella caseinilytica]GFZ93297.1 hybrid sensor histidine kinase/response regulator [Dyella caseinilytica]
MPDKSNHQRSLPRIRVLQVEDSPLDAELILTELQADGIEYEVRLVDDELAFVDTLQAFKPHIVLSDLSMPGFSGQRALELLREHSPETPFIYVSATLGEEAAIAALREGATDYILKQNPARLASAVRRAMREAEEQRAREHAEAELIRVQRFESLAMLAGGLSHDLRNLLQPLLLAGDSLLDYQDDPRLARLGALVRDCGRRGLEMVQSMLSFARGARRAEHVRAQALLDALGLLLQGSVPRSVQLDIEVVDPELSFEGNHTELQQCLLNLCLNAMQAMPNGGVLRVVTSKVRLEEDFFVEHEEAQAGDYVRLSVTDTGQGMTDEVRRRLFEPFFTTKEGGTGLGLLSCRRIVYSHGGAMRVDSIPDEGTCFDLYIPLTRPVVDASALVEGNTALHGNAEHVLLVVEEAGHLTLLTDTLDTWGYEVHASQSGTAALQWIEACGLPDLVVMDGDMSLFTSERTLAALSQYGYRRGVLVLCRADDPADAPMFQVPGRLQRLNKPVSTRDLLQAVRETLQRSDKS